jgi:hypothetical protein
MPLKNKPPRRPADADLRSGASENRIQCWPSQASARARRNADGEIKIGGTALDSPNECEIARRERMKRDGEALSER